MLILVAVRLTKWSFTLLLTLAKDNLCGDYFYNYFTRGLDILFDGQGFVDVVNVETNKLFLLVARSCAFDEVDNSKQSITPSTKWDQEILGDCGRAAIQTQGSTNNPFGSTFVYGYQNIAFEVMKNDYIATVTLFQA
uniref:Uncharacterized protein n=1 Tax=Salix viminalis TaxID=40686 RepID=A0A6N2LKU8_SALVM